MFVPAPTGVQGTAELDSGTEPMEQSRRRLVLELSVWLVIAGGAYAMTFQFDDPIQGYRYGATAWPRAIILMMFAVALLQFLVGLRRVAASAPVQAATRSPIGAAAATKVLLTFALPLAYLLLLPRTGFYLTTPLFLATYLLLLGERNLTRLALVTVIIYAIMIAIFTTVFYVPLPVGNWPVFYDVNVWLLQAFR